MVGLNEEGMRGRGEGADVRDRAGGGRNGGESRKGKSPAVSPRGRGVGAVLGGHGFSAAESTEYKPGSGPWQAAKLMLRQGGAINADEANQLARGLSRPLHAAILAGEEFDWERAERNAGGWGGWRHMHWGTSPPTSPRMRSPSTAWRSPRDGGVPWVDVGLTVGGRGGPPQETSAMVEWWLNEMLSRRKTREMLGLRGQPDIDIAKYMAEHPKGLQEFGLGKAQLLKAGLGEKQIERAYRSLYVFSLGQHDLLLEVCRHSGERTHLVMRIWRAFLAIAEEGVRIQFPSEIADLAEEREAALVEARHIRAQLSAAHEKLTVHAVKMASLAEDKKREVSLRVHSEQELTQIRAEADEAKAESGRAQAKYLLELQHRTDLLCELKDVKDEAGRLAMEVQALQGRLSAMSAREGAAKEEIKAAQMEAMHLGGQLAAEKARGNQTAAKDAEWRARVAEVSRAVAEAERKALDSSQEAQSLQAELAQALGRVRALEAELRVLKAGSAEVRGQLAQCLISVESHREEKRKLEEQVETTELQLKEALSEVEAWKKADGQGKEELEQWMRESERVTAEQVELAGELRRTRDALRVETGEHAYTEGRRRRTEAELMAVRENVASLAVALGAVLPGALAAQRAESRAVARCSDLERRLREAEDASRAMRASLDVSLAATALANEECGSRDAQICQLAEEAAKLRDMVAAEEAKTAWVTKRLSEVTGQVESANAEVAEMQQRLTAVVVAKRTRERELAIVEGQIRSTEEASAGIRAEIARLRDRNATLEEANRRNVRDTERMRAESGTAIGDLKELRETHEATVATLAEVSGRTEAAERDLNAKTEALERKRTKKREWKAIANKEKMEKITWRAKAKGFESQHERISKRILELEFRWGEEKQQRESLETALAETRAENSYLERNVQIVAKTAKDVTLEEVRKKAEVEVEKQRQLAIERMTIETPKLLQEAQQTNMAIAADLEKVREEAAGLATELEKEAESRLYLQETLKTLKARDADMRIALAEQTEEVKRLTEELAQVKDCWQTERASMVSRHEMELKTLKELLDGTRAEIIVDQHLRDLNEVKAEAQMALDGLKMEYEGRVLSLLEETESNKTEIKILRERLARVEKRREEEFRTHEFRAQTR